MREIKIRAWAYASKVMFFPNSEDGWELFDGKIYPTPNTISMQYTGLKDSKRTKEYPEGQEIYEGDIIRYVDGDTSKVIGSVVWDDIGWSPFCWPVDYDEVYLDKSKVRVIGNIYEHRELLDKDGGKEEEKST